MSRTVTATAYATATARYKGGQSVDEIDDLAARMANEVQLDGVSLGFVAISVDDDENRARAAEVGPARWPHLQHFHMPADSINALGVSIVPNRLVLDGRTGQIAWWWRWWWWWWW